jgi:UrcA family protein
MNTETNLPRRSSLESAVLKAALIALCAIAPITVMADTQPPPAAETRAATVSLADLELSTPDGQRAARERLHQIARRLCSQVGDTQDISHQPNFVACVDETLANALQQLNGPAHVAVEESRKAWLTTNATATKGQHSATAPESRATTVSLADLDLSTPQGARAAHDRVHETARRLCSQLEDSQDLSHQRNFVTCVDETMAATLLQLRVPALAGIEQSHTARRTSP